MLNLLKKISIFQSKLNYQPLNLGTLSKIVHSSFAHISFHLLILNGRQGRVMSLECDHAMARILEENGVTSILVQEHYTYFKCIPFHLHFYEICIFLINLQSRFILLKISKVC